MSNITIIGSGSWGIALAIHLSKTGHNLKVWSFAQEEADLINNENKCKFLPNVDLPKNIYCTTNYEEALEGSKIVLVVTPAKFFRNIVKEFKTYIKDQIIVVCSKGIEENTLLTLDEVVLEEIPNSKVGILSGPSHAEEVALGIPTAIVIASKHQDVQEKIQDEFMSQNFRVYTSYDVKGVGLGGSIKNVIALCAGVAAGLGYGDNTFAALITRGLTEIARLGIAMGAQENTFYGLTGLGDLIVTCLSEHSRNRKAGILVAQGKSMQEAQDEIGMVVESFYTIKASYKLMQKYEVEMPILSGMYNVLFNNYDLNQTVKDLLNRDKKSE